MKFKLLTILLLLYVGLMVTSCQGNGSISSESSEITIPDTSPVETSSITPDIIYYAGNELFGMISVTGEVIIQPQYNYLDLFSDEGLARFQDRENGLWGYVDKNGLEVISAQYIDANNFSEGLAAVKVDGLFGFVDVTAMIVIEPQFEGVVEGFLFDRCIISKDGKQGIIDQTGKIIVEPQYLSIDLYCENYFIVQFQDHSYGVIDRSGEIMAEDYVTRIYAVTDSGFFFVYQKSGFHFMYDFDGNKSYALYIYDSDRSQRIHDDSLVVVSPDGEKWGLFDLSKGKYTIEAVYDNIEYQPGNEYAQTFLEDPHYFTGAVNIATGQVILNCNNMYIKEEYGYILYADENYDMGVVDSLGQTILPAVYQQICATPQGDFFVIKGNRYYLIDSEGNTLKEFKDLYLCDYAASIDVWSFEYTGLEPIEELRISGFLDGSFNIIVDHEYFLFSVNNNGLVSQLTYPNPIDVSTTPVIVREDNQLGEYRFINSSGYAEGWYSSISWFPDQGVLVVEDIDGNCGLVSYDGTVLFALQPCQIFTNSDYEYDSYNDSDYLIYSVEAESVD